jgi:hypothetical protein
MAAIATLPGLDELGAFVHRRELKALRKVLAADEQVRSAVGAYAGRQRGLLLATDRRIVWVAAGLLRRTTRSSSYEGILKVEVEVNLDGATITFTLPHHYQELFTRADRKGARAFAAAVRGATARQAFRKVRTVTDPAQATPAEQMLDEPFRTRLARLERMHARGTLTEPEYKASRQRILDEAEEGR